MSERNDNAWGVYGSGTGNTTAVVFDCATTSATNQLPAAWGNGGYWVHMRAMSCDARYLFHDASTGTVAASVAGTTSGAQAANLGGYLQAGITYVAKVPRGHTYFARIDSSGTTDILVELRSTVGDGR